MTEPLTLRQRLLFIRDIASGEGGDEASRRDPLNALATIVINCDEALAAPAPDALREALIHAARDVDGAWGSESDDDGADILWFAEAGEVLADLRTAIERYDAAPPAAPEGPELRQNGACCDRCEHANDGTCRGCGSRIHSAIQPPVILFSEARHD